MLFLNSIAVCIKSLPKFQQLIKSCWDCSLLKKYKHSLVHTAYSIEIVLELEWPRGQNQRRQHRIPSVSWFVHTETARQYMVFLAVHEVNLKWLFRQILNIGKETIPSSTLAECHQSQPHSKVTFFYLFFRNNPISLDSLSALASSLQCIKSRKLEEIKVTQNILGPQLHQALSRLKAVVKNVVAEHLDKTTLFADFVSQMWLTAWIKDQKRKKLILKLKSLFGNWLNFCEKLTYLSLDRVYLLYCIVLKRITNTAWYLLFSNVFKINYYSTSQR